MTVLLRSICTGRVHIKQSTALSFVLSYYVLRLCAEPLLAPTSAHQLFSQGLEIFPFMGLLQGSCQTRKNAQAQL